MNSQTIIPKRDYVMLLKRNGYDYREIADMIGLRFYPKINSIIDVPKDIRAHLFETRGKKCEYCGGTHRITVHHVRYTDNPDDMLLLCQKCHVRAHKWRDHMDSPLVYEQPHKLALVRFAFKVDNEPDPPMPQPKQLRLAFPEEMEHVRGVR